MRQSTPTELTRMMVEDAFGRFDRGEPIIFVDTRNPQAWEESDVKLPGAIRVPAGDVKSHLREIPRGRTLVTYCT